MIKTKKIMKKKLDFADWLLENGYNFEVNNEGGIDPDANEENKELFDECYEKYTFYCED